MVFISYSSKEYEIASKLKNLLLKNEIPCWMAPESIPPGGNYSSAIPRAINACDTFIVLLSVESQKSIWVPKELGRAFKGKKHIIPIHIDESIIEEEFEFKLENVQCIDAHKGIDTIEKQIVDSVKENIIPHSMDIKTVIPEEITFFELFNANSTRDIDIEKIREKSNITKSMSVPIGKNEKNEIISIDLHQRGDGPNCIVSGPPGSGKSEFIKTYLLSLALHFSPEDVQFHIIDMCNGWLVRAMEGLPHLKECLVKRDENMAKQFVLNIKDELQKRKGRLKNYEVKNIYQYLKLRINNGNTIPPMPHIIVAIDELTTLKAKMPNIVEEICVLADKVNTDALGVHLVYGTQSIHGIVNDKIFNIVDCWICSNMHPDLGMAEPAKSENALPGRLYFQSPTQGSVQLVQLAYCEAIVDSQINDRSGLKKYQWYFKNKSQKEVLINMIKRFSLD